ncbi:hypothetical protein V8F20_004799 [Naviculisporaceae sp. PSN 640]
MYYYCTRRLVARRTKVFDISTYKFRLRDINTFSPLRYQLLSLLTTYYLRLRDCYLFRQVNQSKKQQWTGCPHRVFPQSVRCWQDLPPRTCPEPKLDSTFPNLVTRPRVIGGPDAIAQAPLAAPVVSGIATGFGSSFLGSPHPSLPPKAWRLSGPQAIGSSAPLDSVSGFAISRRGHGRDGQEDRKVENGENGEKKMSGENGEKNRDGENRDKKGGIAS